MCLKKLEILTRCYRDLQKKYISEILEKVPMKPLLTENMIEDMANELKFETIDEGYFSSGPIKFKVTIVRAMMPEYYKKQKKKLG